MVIKGRPAERSTKLPGALPLVVKASVPLAGVSDEVAVVFLAGV